MTQVPQVPTQHCEHVAVLPPLGHTRGFTQAEVLGRITEDLSSTTQGEQALLAKQATVFCSTRRTMPYEQL